ncbi:MAG: D-alanyl-D-alanine carboxypeptidase family protein [Ruminococcaceae bacterium]|nr:D-alanyl-D-alanine carboxypeptidase family protein [Oscillospiraceae bacterium]
MKDEKSIRAKEYTRKYAAIYTATAILCVLVGVALSLTVMKLTEGMRAPITTTPTETFEVPGTTAAPTTTALETTAPATTPKPTDVKVEIKTSAIGNSQLSHGPLIIVNETYPYDPANTKNELVVFKEQSDNNLAVVTWGISTTMDTYKALNTMHADMKAELSTEYKITVVNGYSDKSQTSELGTGLSVTIKFMKGTGSYQLSDPSVSKEYKWLTENAWKYGLVFRYPEDKTLQTGHPGSYNQLRYVGKEHAKYMYDNKLCLEEYVQEIKDYTFNAPLELAGDECKYRIYYIPMTEGKSTDIQYRSKSPLETYGTLVVSGDNSEGFIVVQQYFEK